MLIRLPESWPPSVVAALAMVALAALDLGGAILAKEAVQRHQPWLAVAGAGLFLLLFWVYASSLQYAELAPVTFGWIVVLQVGVVLLDRFHYGIGLPTGKWVAVVVILAAQAYLLLGPDGKEAAQTPAPEPRPAATEPAVRPTGRSVVPAPRTGDHDVPARTTTITVRTVPPEPAANDVRQRRRTRPAPATGVSSRAREARDVPPTPDPADVDVRSALRGARDAAR